MLHWSVAQPAGHFGLIEPKDLADIVSAPKTGYRADTALVAPVNRVIVIQSADPNTCGVSITGSTLYGKVVVLAMQRRKSSPWPCKNRFKRTSRAIPFLRQNPSEAELNLETNAFSYNIKSGAINLSQLQVLKSLGGLLGGNVTLTSTGAGTLDHPVFALKSGGAATRLGGIENLVNGQTGAEGSTSGQTANPLGSLAGLFKKKKKSP